MNTTYNQYQAFLDRKAQANTQHGFAPLWIPDCLFDFQKYFVDWSIRQGRAAIFEDCGLGKTLQQLVWGRNVVRCTNKSVLLTTPLAVSGQTLAEAEKFGIEAKVSRDGKPAKGITITNYERLHLFDPADYSGMICDESSILKNFAGATKAAITEFMRQMKYRLLCTATACPNDFIELGTSSEALGELGYTDMLSRFFINSENTVGTGRMYGKQRQWRFKGHAEIPFWRWLSSWTRAARKPSDYGFDDARFVLPPKTQREHIVKAGTLAPGFLFEMPAKGLAAEREEQRRTMKERCETAATLAQGGRSVVIWCNLNDEGDLLEKLTGFPQAKGSTSERDLARREEVLTAFSSGQIRGLITKPKIGAFGLNWQHCAHAIVFPTHSYEQMYQIERRFWRFGQTQEVVIDLVATESGHDIQLNLQRKAAQMDRMFTGLVAHMNDALKIERGNGFHKSMEVPQWLS